MTRVDDPIGYEVIIMELKSSFKSYCELYGLDVAKKAVRQAYTEVFKNEQVPCAENNLGRNKV